MTGAWAYVENYRWFVDGGVQIPHLNQDKTPALAGYHEDVKRGKWLSTQQKWRQW